MSKPLPQKPNARPVDQDDELPDDAIIGVALRWSLLVICVLVLSAGALALVLARPRRPPPAVQRPAALPKVRVKPPAAAPTVSFVDVTSRAGIDFRHENGAYGDKLLPETMGGGCAFFDFDGDGDQDLLLVNSARWPWDPRPPAAEPATMRLYRNDGSGIFSDATVAAGLDVSFYGMGVAVGDYDNDGDPDLFFSAVGPDRLFRNDGGRFVDVTDEAGVAGAADQWGTSCGWFDYDNDGLLDLFVCNYVQWSREIDIGQGFTLDGQTRAYGPPTSFYGTFPYLYHNEGQGRFRDVTAEAGVQVKNPATEVPMAKSMGLAPIDLDGDGWLDLVVANDTVQNFLFRNRRDGTFQEIGALAGIAFDAAGNARGAMGIDAGRFRNDQTLGVVIGNFANEMTALYCASEDPLQFVDAAIATDLGPQTRLELTFGVFFFDYDLDGRLDVLAANGHLEEEINKVQVSQQYQQPPQLFWNAGAAKATEFLKVGPDQCGRDFSRRMVGRGAAYADIDGDGDLDVLITEVGGRPRLLRNEQQLRHHWLRFRLRGTSANRDAIGAWVEVHTTGGVVQHRQVMPTRSYLSQSELPVTFGLGESPDVERVIVTWPDGTRQELRDVAPDTLTDVVQAAAG